MQVLITKASDYKFQEFREMTAEDILELIEEFKQDIVVERRCREDSFDHCHGADYRVTIYDDYLE